MMEDDGTDDDTQVHCTKLGSGFVVYFADNVLVMLMATTAGTLGQSLFQFSSISQFAVNIFGIAFNTVLAVLMYLFAASRFHAAEEESGSSSEETETDWESKEDGAKVNGEGSPLNIDLNKLGTQVKKLEDGASTGYSHIIQMLPWVIIVPMVNLPVYFSTEIYARCKDDQFLGMIFVWHVIMFAIYLTIEIVSARIYSARPDSGSKCESLPTFLLNSWNHSMLSSAGKALHLTEVVVYQALTGQKQTDRFQPQQKAVESLLLMGITWFLLVHAWPRLREETLRDRLFKSIITTITVYSWAFSFINNLFNFFTTDIEHGAIWYWTLMGGFLIAAVLLASRSDLNFYGGPSAAGKGFGLMLCWAVDFGVWWAWAQVMTNIDAAVAPNSDDVLMLLVTNSSILIGLIAITSLVYIYGDLQSMSAASRHRHQHSQGHSAFAE